MLRRRLASLIPTTTVSNLAPLRCVSLQFPHCQSDDISKPDCRFGGIRAYSSLLPLKDPTDNSVLPRWRNILIIKSTIAQSTKIATTASRRTGFASFHSTNAVSEKWKITFTCDVKERQIPKNNIRYAVKEKRSDTKKALKSLLSNGRSFRSTDESFPGTKSNYADQLNKKSRITRQAKAYHKKLKRKLGKENSFEDSGDNPDRIFHAAFGDRDFTWNFRRSKMGFDWTKNYEWSNGRFNKQSSESSTEYGNKSFTIGSYADRKMLGLPTAGPLEIEDVKAAFRVSALKWHPDKHQGSSKADAEEKFKNCVNAYKSLCNTLSAAA